MHSQPSAQNPPPRNNIKVSYHSRALAMLSATLPLPLPYATIPWAAHDLTKAYGRTTGHQFLFTRQGLALCVLLSRIFSRPQLNTGMPEQWPQRCLEVWLLYWARHRHFLWLNTLAIKIKWLHKTTIKWKKPWLCICSLPKPSEEWALAGS